MQEAGQGGSGKVDDIFNATLMQASGDRNKLDMERDRHREEVEELEGDVNMLATKLKQREEELEPLNVKRYLINYPYLSDYWSDNILSFFSVKGQSNRTRAM